MATDEVTGGARKATKSKLFEFLVHGVGLNEEKDLDVFVAAATATKKAIADFMKKRVVQKVL